MAQQARETADQEMRRIVQESIEEYVRRAAEEKEPAATAALAEERRRREQLERRLNELSEENSRHRAMAEEVERHSRIKSELQQLGVKKPDLAFRLVKDEVFRGDDGQLYGRSEQGTVAIKEYLAKFITENPEFLPARIAGGSGASAGNRPEAEGGSFDLNKIRPGMSAEEKERARREIARVAGKEVLWWL
ncbi:MAG TPA: hypothetical protein VEU62_04180 [Bryobacterales bacterium]|nr:hypothetical protein [Bryobacterales bacterium]